ncbi:MAG: M28 family peptidase [Treponemataceae bacterium]
MINPYDTLEFKEFLKPECDRLSWICNWLSRHEIEYAIIPTGKLRHVYLNFSRLCYDNSRIIKTVLVHYDRIGIGANDNSAAVYQVLHWAVRLNQTQNSKAKQPHNVRIIFTDGEELGLGTSKDDLGVLSLASLFKQKKIVNNDIFAIDSCGRGDTLVISTSGKNSGSIKFQHEFKEFYDRTIELAQYAVGRNWVTIPTSYGDNAGFILLGMRAIAISVLPHSEAGSYMRSLQKNPSLKSDISNHKISNSQKNAIPPTWLMMHTPLDCFENLTSESWYLMESFLTALEKRL